MTLVAVPAAATTILGRCRAGVEALYPGYFALVMATGIVSLGAHFEGMDLIARILFWFNGGAYVVLWLLTLLRLLMFPRRLLGDLTDYARGVAFNTMVAGTCVLGTQFAILTSGTRIAQLLWVLGFGLWVVLNYTFFTAATVREPKPSLENGINGAWLILVVGTESVAILGTLVAPTMATGELVQFASLAMFFIGAMLYIALITLILYRWMFFTMEAARLTPPYWINMGALAITTLAGSRLMLAAEHSALLGDYTAFLKGFTLFFWATATWWIPLLAIVGIWRHVYERVPLTYSPLYWSLVFPLGMYTVATFMYARASGVDFLAEIPHVFIYIALTAWTFTFIGLLRSLARLLLSKAQADAA